MKLCMIGTGYVGLVSGVCFSDLGNDVVCVDKDKNKIDLLKKGKIPIYEPGLSELAIKNYRNKRLTFSSDLKTSIRNSDIIFICVGTPTKKKGTSADLSQVYNVAKDLSSSIWISSPEKSSTAIVWSSAKMSEHKKTKII